MALPKQLVVAVVDFAPHRKAAHTCIGHLKYYLSVSRLLVCWLFVNQQSVIVAVVCTKTNHHDHCCCNCDCDQQ